MKNSPWLGAALVALSIIVLGLCLKSGIDNFTNKDRKVVVKGLAEREVEADKVTWPIVSKEPGNDLMQLYEKIGATERKIKQFLLSGGITAAEISTSAPQVNDLQARDWGGEQRGAYRYIVTSVLTVTTKNVKKARALMQRQGNLLKEGVAIGGGDYENPIVYEYVAFRSLKPAMMQEAIENAEKTAQQFATNSHSKLNKIVSADQGQFSIDNRDANTPYIKKVRVVTTVTYSLKD